MALSIASHREGPNHATHSNKLGLPGDFTSTSNCTVNRSERFLRTRIVGCAARHPDSATIHPSTNFTGNPCSRNKSAKATVTSSDEFNTTGTFFFRNRFLSRLNIHNPALQGTPHDVTCIALLPARPLPVRAGRWDS